MLLSDLIKEVRMNNLLTQTEFAKWADVDQVSISHYERGTRKPGLKSLKKLIDAINLKAGMNLKYSDVDH